MYIFDILCALVNGKLHVVIGVQSIECIIANIFCVCSTEKCDTEK